MILNNFNAVILHPTSAASIDVEFPNDILISEIVNQLIDFGFLDDGCEYSAILRYYCEKQKGDLCIKLDINKTMMQHGVGGMMGVINLHRINTQVCGETQN